MLELVLVSSLLCLTVVTWSVLAVRRRAGQPWVPLEARDPVPWGLVDVFLALGLLFVVTSVAVAMLRAGAAPPTPQWQDAELSANDVLAQMLASLATLAISITTIWVRYRATSADFGWSAARIGSDIRLGAVAFLAVAPPVYALQLVLVQWFESKHPLVELIQRDPQPKLIAICAVSAVMVAPVMEEYVFRGLLQGWLERLAGGRDSAQDVPDHFKADVPPAYWPIVASAFAFSIMHLPHGPDWIPLFVLALGLGYLYRQTHRLLPAIVVHFLLNTCSLLMLLVS